MSSSRRYISLIRPDTLTLIMQMESFDFKIKSYAACWEG